MLENRTNRQTVVTIDVVIWIDIVIVEVQVESVVRIV